MRLIHFMTMRMLLAAAAVLAFWSVLFYYVMIDEINDEQDDSLEDYAELVMRRFLRGEKLPDQSSGTNNQYYLHAVSEEYAQQHEGARYVDEEIFIEYKDEYEPARTIFYIFNDNQDNFYEISVSVPTIDKGDLKEDLYWFILILYIAIICALGIISLVAVKRTMKPLWRLLDWMSLYKPGQANEPLKNPTRIFEFKRLNDGVNELVERNERHDRQQQLFISNASHEMQTPLAICTGRLEALLEDENLNEQQMGEIVKTLRTLGSLSKLNKSLLMLSRIEKGQYDNNQANNLCNIINRHLPDYQSLYAAKQITVETDIDTPFELQIDEQLADILILNLLKNAFAHNQQQGRITISSDNRSLTFANTGNDTALDPDKIFLPFYHTLGKKSSTGLGLAMVQAICRRYGIDITYSFRQDMHCFTLSR